jgi:hypothetical protein
MRRNAREGLPTQVDRDSFSQSSAGTIRFFTTFTIKRQVRGSARLQRTARAKPAKRAGLAATCRSSHLGIPRPAPHSSQRRKHYVDGELSVAPAIRQRHLSNADNFPFNARHAKYLAKVGSIPSNMNGCSNGANRISLILLAVDRILKVL